MREAPDAVRELSIFIDESGDLGPPSVHSPYYILSLVFHDQADDINDDLDHIHSALTDRGLPSFHAIHTAPLVRREQDYSMMTMSERRALFRVLVDFVRRCNVSYQSWVFVKQKYETTDDLISDMSRQLGAFIRENTEFFTQWDRIVIYYDNGQKEITNLVNSVFNALLEVEVRNVVPSDYSLFQAADLFCTITLLQTKVAGAGLSNSEQDFFSTKNDSAVRALKKGYFKTLDQKRFGVAARR